MASNHDNHRSSNNDIDNNNINQQPQLQRQRQQNYHYRGGSCSAEFGDTTLRKVFVGGLAWETRAETMRRYFEQFGEILEAVVIADKITGRSKGYGFVTFRDEEAARMACMNPKPIIDGRRANCNIAAFGRSRPARPPRPSLPRGGRIPVRGSYEAADNMTGPSFPYAYQPNIAYAPYQYPSYFPEILYGPNIYNPYVMPQYPQMFAASAASSPAIYSYGPSPAFVAPHAMSFQNSGAVQYGNQSDSSVTSVPPTHYAFASALQTGLIPPTIAAGQSLAQLRMPTQTQTGEDILEEAHSGSLAGIH